MAVIVEFSISIQATDGRKFCETKLVTLIKIKAMGAFKDYDGEVEYLEKVKK